MRTMGAGEGEPQTAKCARIATPGKRAPGCLPLILMLAALPILVVGFLIYASANKSASANSGIAGGLSGLGELVGIGAMVLAALLFVVGAVFFVRAAKR